MTTRLLEVSSCESCPSAKIERVYTADSFETVLALKCQRKNGAHVAEREWNEPWPAIPEWCSLPKKEIK